MVRRLRVLFMVMRCLGVVLALAAPAMAAKRPTHVIIVVMDQMQPGYAKQFAMANVLSLQQHGVTFPNAYVGDMASETVVSHNVMVSGQFPKHMGWSDEAFRDVDNVLGFGANAIVTSGDLGYDQYVKLIDEWDYNKLGDYLHQKFPAPWSPTSVRRATRSSPWPPPAPTGTCAWAARRRSPICPIPASCPGPAPTAGPPARSRITSRTTTATSSASATPAIPTTPRSSSRPGCTPRTAATWVGRTRRIRAVIAGWRTRLSRSWRTRTGPGFG